MTKFFNKLLKEIKKNNSNFIMIILSIILIILAFVIMDDISFPLFGVAIIIIGIVLLRIINNKNL